MVYKIKILEVRALKLERTVFFQCWELNILYNFISEIQYQEYDSLAQYLYSPW